MRRIGHCGMRGVGLWITAATQSVTLTAAGMTPVTVTAATISGTGFAIVGARFPITLNPAQTLALQVQFQPTTAGAQTAQITFSSTATTGNATLALSGTGSAAAPAPNPIVNLKWDAPATSPDAVAGYHIYRATGSGPFVLVNMSADAPPVYVDTGVASGTTYNYQVKSVDSKGIESVPSNKITITVP